MTTQSLKLQLEQLNFIVGDLSGNYQKIISAYKKAVEQSADLVIFSELALSGYPPEDLLQKSFFTSQIAEEISKICALTKNHTTAILLGAPLVFSDKNSKKFLYNCAVLIENGEVINIARKCNLPNYGVFDEKRYFSAATNLTCADFRGFNIAILICEDLWNQKNAFLLAEKNPDFIIVINASPFDKNKFERRVIAAKTFIQTLKKPLIYVNQIGAQDGLIFDGNSFVVDDEEKIKLQMADFAEDSASLTVKKNANKDYEKYEKISIQTEKEFADSISIIEERVYQAAILGIRDYVGKNDFEKIIISISGGIDSALAASIAVDAIGNNRVKLIALPSRYNSNSSLEDAKNCATNLGIELEIISIEPIFEAMLASLKDKFIGRESDVTEENIQSRIRGMILMALSNKFGGLVLATGNKSELAVGYCTIYGDMCGGFNPLKDIYKSEIFNLAKWRNKTIPKISLYQKTNLIPNEIIGKAPSAELRANQKDSDSLPEYEILDKILLLLIEEQKSIEEICALGFDVDLVKKIAKLFYNSEYKRRQSVIGVRVSKMSFDKDRRYPMSNKFCE